MICEDFVMLGKSVPECSSDGRLFVCSAGASLELKQLIRIYPLAWRQCPPRWSMSRVPLERNFKDSRRESWKIRGDRSPAGHERINEQIELVSPAVTLADKKKIIQMGLVRSIREANERRLSLAFVQPVAEPRLKFEPGETAEMAPTPAMIAGPVGLPVKERFAWHPRLRFADEDGEHDLMLRDWGCYEFLRKHGDERRPELHEALRLGAAPPMLIGNFNRHRNAWLIISVLSSQLAVAKAKARGQVELFVA
jgi:hypothetical protein